MALAPAYRVVTDRLVLRPWNPDDAAGLRGAIERGSAHLGRFLPWAREVPTLDEELAQCRRMRGWFDMGQDTIYGAFLRADERVIVGGTWLHPRVGPGACEIGYWVDVDHVRRGIAVEMAAAMTRIGFEIGGLDRIEIHCAAENTASAGVPPKLGYVHEATLPRRLPNAEGGLSDRKIYSLWLADYPKSPAAKVRVDAYDGVGRAFSLGSF
ncbi:MAG: GNAT family N-acetyltransferase [Polyangiales bacterium]